MKAFLETIKKNKIWLISAGAVIVLLGIWEIAAIAVGAEIILPRLSSTVTALGGLFAKQSFYAAIGNSLLHCLISFAAAFVLGIIAGAFAGLRPAFAAAVRPVVAFIHSVPTLAVVLILMLMFGKQAAPTVIGVMLVFPVIYETTKTAIANIDKQVVELARLDGAGLVQSVRYVYIPLSLPYIFGAIGSSFGLCIKGVISAEILAYTAGSIGYEMKFASLDSALASTPVLFAWVIVVLVISILFEFALKGMFKKISAKFL